MSIFIQHKYDITYAVVYYENIYFHQEKYSIETQVSKVKNNDLPFPLFTLNTTGTVHFSTSSEYTCILRIPQGYAILNHPENTDYHYLISSRKYRNLQGKTTLFLYAKKEMLPEQPVTVTIKRDNKVVYADTPFFITSENKIITVRNKIKKSNDLDK